MLLDVGQHGSASRGSKPREQILITERLSPSPPGDLCTHCRANMSMVGHSGSRSPKSRGKLWSLRAF